MRKIKSKHIIMAFLSVILFSLCLIAGSFHSLFFIFAALFLITYVLIDRKFLRCPHCSGFINLDGLIYAKTHIYHCSHCGKVIEIES